MKGQALGCGRRRVRSVNGSAHAATATYSSGSVTNLTTSCAGQYAEVAADRRGDAVIDREQLVGA